MSNEKRIDFTTGSSCYEDSDLSAAIDELLHHALDRDLRRVALTAAEPYELIVCRLVNVVVDAYFLWSFRRCGHRVSPSTSVRVEFNKSTEESY